MRNKNIKRNYFLVFIIIASSGIPFFSGIDFIEILLFLISLILFLYNKEKKDPKAFLIVFLFFLIELFQHLLHGNYGYRTSIGTAVKLITAYFVVKLVKSYFISYYVNILYVLTLFSFLFYGLSFLSGVNDFIINQIAPFFQSPFVNPDAFYQPSPQIIVYTYNPISVAEYRNSGPFWEPGAFAVYLIIALVFNTIITKSLIQKKNKIFIIGLLTTFSTAGYIAFFIFVSGYYLLNKKVSHKLLLIFFVFASVSIYTTTTFLQEKINHNISVANETTSSRFGSALADYNLFKQSPLFGWGRGPMRYGGQKIIFFGKDQHRNNGVFVQLATYGILGSLLYFYLFYKSIFRINKYYNFIKGYSFVFFATIMTLGFSQSLFSKPFFLCFLFLFLAIKSEKRKIQI